MAFPNIKGITIKGAHDLAYEDILTGEALQFLRAIHLKFNDRRKELLAKRQERQKDIDKGILPDFLPETKSIREGDWVCAPLPQDLLDRRVEITGPVDRKMVINALNSGAKIFMADFEDSNTPSWSNNMQGQINLRDANLRTIEFVHPTKNKTYKLNDQVATLLVRPRGWHLEEKNILIDGEKVSGGIMDFALYLFHNHAQLKAIGSGPYYYLPKLESHLEARLWNDIFVFAQDYLSIPQKTIKATVLVETIMASFEMDEILYELRDHSAGLNCGRWDYIFSYIKRLRNTKDFIMPNRAQVGMTTPFMSAYSQLVIKTCHKRGVHAMGGMAAQIPIKNDEAANKAALEKVRIDKEREVQNGHDGSWVAHPALVKIAMDVFDKHMPEANQIATKKREDVHMSAANLLEQPIGTITEDGVRKNINVGILYLESWLRGNGAAAIYNLMEDAATAEDDGTAITYDYYKSLLPSELDKIKSYVGADNYKNGKFEQATSLFDDLIKSEDFTEFLTLPAYDLI